MLGIYYYQRQEMRKGGGKMAEEEKELCESLEISLERLTIKSQALK